MKVFEAFVNTIRVKLFDQIKRDISSIVSGDWLM